MRYITAVIAEASTNRKVVELQLAGIGCFTAPQRCNQGNGGKRGRMLQSALAEMQAILDENPRAAFVLPMDGR